MKMLVSLGLVPGKWALVPSQALLGSDELFSTLFCGPKYKGFGKALEFEWLRCFFHCPCERKGLLGSNPRIEQALWLQPACCVPWKSFAALPDSAGTSQPLSTAHKHVCVPCTAYPSPADPCPGEEHVPC